jgi:alpha-beta hydrolase superfamily lysophospholipase
MRVGAKRVTGLLGGTLLALNFVAYRQAHSFTHYAPNGHRTRPKAPSPAGLAGILLTGVEVPRPENRRAPSDVGLNYERHMFAGSRGIPLEAWFVPHPEARGTVALFHGHAASKDSQLREARVFHEMRLNALLVDFHGSGGSAGSDTTIGFREAEDVASAFSYATHLPGGRPIVLYGTSMGAAAVLKAVADDGLLPAGLILECPFDSLITTVRHRFTSYGIPSFPLAELLVFWGGVEGRFNAFDFCPKESALRVARPTLLMNGDSDPWVRVEEARAIFDALRGPKTLKLFAGLGHDSCLRHDPDGWKGTVADFLVRVLPP